MNQIDKLYFQVKNDKTLKTVIDAYDSAQDPLVTVNVEVFNHEKYLKECLDSILGQKVSFNVVVHIHDDASTDGSRAIIEEYKVKYPNIIFPIIQKQNVYCIHQKENDVLTIQGLRVKGKYVAMCEGDDYWTNPFKLQTQVLLMERHPEAHLCLHTVEKINENTKELMCLMPQFKLESSILSSESFIKIILKKYAFQTSSYLFKAEDSINFYSDLPEFASVMPTGDETMILYYGQLGNVIYINQRMSVYRKFADGSWSVRHRKYSEEKNDQVNFARVKSLEAYDTYTSLRFHKSCLERKNRILLAYYLREKQYDKVLEDRDLRKFCKRKHFVTYVRLKHPKIYNLIRRTKR